MSKFSFFVLNPLMWFPVLFGIWAAWRVIRWAASGEKTRLSGRPGLTLGGFEGASSAIHTLYGPSAQPMMEMEFEKETDRQDDEEGGPPKPGLKTKQS